MLRLCLLTAVLFSVAVACSTSDVSEPDHTSTPDPAREIRAVADKVIDVINAHRYAEMYDLIPSGCLEGLTRDELADDWRDFGEQIGDPNFQLEITQFEVETVSDDRAQVTAQVVAHTAARDIPMGSAEDPFFDVFIREGHVWKVGDETYCP
jgi:hypothetical protein